MRQAAQVPKVKHMVGELPSAHSGDVRDLQCVSMLSTPTEEIFYLPNNLEEFFSLHYSILIFIPQPKKKEKEKQANEQTKGL